MEEKIERLEKALMLMAGNLSTYGGGSVYDKVHEIMYPPDKNDFLECDTCRAKPGSPTLCKGCLHNRTLIEDMKKTMNKKER